MRSESASAATASGQRAARPLRVLLVEDSEPDAALLLRHLERGGFAVTHRRVDTPEAMSEALADQAWDIVLSDYAMPRFGGDAALALVKERGLDLPFIIVSGAVPEQLAVRAMRSGAHDYFLKADLGPRFIAAIERELTEASVRADNLRMQEHLLISNCLASMGTLAAGVAHEINNPLTSVLANIDLAAATLSSRLEHASHGGAAEDLIDEMRDAKEGAERIKTIVRDIKIFSRPLSDTTVAVNIESILESTLRMAWNEIRYRARLVKHYGAVPQVDASESRLGQVFLNLVVNAAQAMPEARWADNKLTISTSTDANGWAVVEIQDTGVHETTPGARRMSRPPARPPTIGLGICERIVNDLMGKLEFERLPDVGSVSRVKLPPATPAVVERRSEAVAATASRRGRVLVIDDQPRVGRAVADALTAEHEVVMLRSAQDAIDKIMSGEHFDVILCSVLMPGLSGIELHDRLSKSAPEQARNIIFLSSGSNSPRARAFLAKSTNQRIPKAFDPTHLRSLVNDRLR